LTRVASISICVCSRNRQDGLRRLLESFLVMHIPQDTDIRVIIVENDVKAKSEALVKSYADKANFRIQYFLETQQGLAYARNRSVKEAGDCDFCCFVDDDQVVAEDWLTELVKCQKEFMADGVWGTNPPVFSKNVLPSIRKFHTPKTYQYGEVVRYAFTNCLLLRKEYLDKIPGPFDPRLNFTGGEDRYMTTLISDQGAVIRCNPNAIAYEIIPDNRTTIKFYISRIYRIANAALYVRTLENENYSKWSAFPRLFLRFSYGLLILIPFFLFGKESKLKGLGKMANAIGGFAFMLRIRNKYYKTKSHISA
jgi:succinoglycan biosynthesis protein ExoM